MIGNGDSYYACNVQLKCVMLWGLWKDVETYSKEMSVFDNTYYTKQFETVQGRYGCIGNVNSEATHSKVWIHGYQNYLEMHLAPTSLSLNLNSHLFSSTCPKASLLHSQQTTGCCTLDGSFRAARQA